MKEILAKLVEGKDLTKEEAMKAQELILTGQATEAQIACFLTALRMKGETLDEITGLAAVLRNKANTISPKVADYVDFVGTGGDCTYSFNISTTSAFVVAAAGLPVAKHGNRSISSKSGAGDVLEALGVNISADPAVVEKCVETVGIGFMFAPHFNPAMKYVGPVRKELGIRTVFDFLGPLANPAGATMELMGVYDESLCRPLGQVLSNLGVKRALVVYGQDSMDEISMSAPTTVCEVRDGWIKNYTIKPEDFGLVRCRKEDLTGGTAKENAEICRRILSGRDRGPKRDAVLINAGAALYMAGKENSIKEGVELAAHTIDCGAAFEKMDQFISATNQ